MTEIATLLTRRCFVEGANHAQQIDGEVDPIQTDKLLQKEVNC